MNKFEYIHLNTFENQVNILEEQASAAERPYIKRAFEEVGKIKGGDDRDVKIGRIYGIACAYSRMGGSEFVDPPGAIIVSSEVFKTIMPKLISLRKHIFKSESAPFPNQPLGAVSLIQRAFICVAGRFLAPNPGDMIQPNGDIVPMEASFKISGDAFWDLIGRPSRDTAGNPVRIGSKTEQKLLDGINDLIKLGDRIYDFKRREEKDISSEVFEDDFGLGRNLKFSKGTKLGGLLQKTKNLAAAGPFSQAALILYVLTNIKPIALGYMIRKKKSKIMIDIYRPLTKKDTENIYLQTKQLFKVAGKALTEKHLKIYDLIVKYGGLPRGNKMEFWQKIHKEWNAIHPRDKFTSSDGLRKAYQRILKKVDGDPRRDSEN